ncbi:alginate lyase family protein [Rhizobium sp. BR 314]|uniref:alginate lyase family protein n=1 Tax=Rhizobium sp. BR 314 TaxID=3040013 RepID=UPI0039BFFEC5
MVLIGTSTTNAASSVFVHPGALHTQVDFARMKAKVAQNAQPWMSDWDVLIKNRHASLNWTPHPVETVYRGADGIHPENYSALFNDTAAAYALALRWKISGDNAYADKAVTILDAWSGKLTGIGGTSDKFLASGVYGYQLAAVAEIMHGYQKWSTANFDRFKTMMLTVFYPMNHDFLVRHNGAKVDHYWANWDLANMDSMLAIGILTDRRDIYNEAVDYFKYGKGNGAIDHVVWKLYPDGLGQTQESGRDQGHNTLNVALLGAFCQMAWNQHDDLFGYEDNRVLKGVEYIAKYNQGGDVPYTSYSNSDVIQNVISSNGRGDKRPVWELFYNHYVVLKGLDAPNLAMAAKAVRPEGGGGNYGPNSGGFDQLGYGTLTYTLK